MSLIEVTVNDNQLPIKPSILKKLSIKFSKAETLEIIFKFENSLHLKANPENYKLIINILNLIKNRADCDKALMDLYCITREMKAIGSNEGIREILGVKIQFNGVFIE